MNKENSYFIKILSDYIKRTDSDYCAEISWEEICRLARIHQVEGIVYLQCNTFMPEDKRNEYYNYYLHTLYDYLNREALMNVITDMFNKSGIEFFVVKGLTISGYYPVPAMRTMGDCDIVIHRRDFPDAVGLLRANGFIGNDITTSEQWGCEKNGFHFEIHDKLLQDGEYATNRQIKFFNDYDRFISDGAIDPSFHFLFLLMHLRKHFLNRGVGVRQFMDLALMSQKEPELRWDWIEKTLFELGLQTYAHVCYSLIERWFGVSIPAPKEKLSEESFELITDKIMRNGVFGYDDSGNLLANAHTALLKAKGPMWVRRGMVLLQNTFLSYEVMRGYADCGFLDGRPWLLPVAWGKRFISIAKRKDNSRAREVIKNSFIPTNELDDRRDLLEKMGLL